jgi:cytochrome c biogenesis factor
MTLTITPTQILKVLHVVSWIIFIGLCVNAGGVLFNAFFALYINPMASQNFWQTINLGPLYDFDKVYFIAFALLMAIVAILKAILFYLIVKLLHDKNLDLNQPFNNKMTRFVANVAYLSLGISFFSKWGEDQTKWLIEKSIQMPAIQDLDLGGADVWFFMGIIFWVLKQLFKRGEAIQTENDLTV